MNNGHYLERITERGTEPCWRVAHLADLRARLSPTELATWKGFFSSDYPNGLIHDETCRTCHGSGRQPVNVTVAFYCMGCGQRGDRDLFQQSSCLRIGDGFYEELIACHEIGDHFDYDHHRCPSCIKRRRLAA